MESKYYDKVDPDEIIRKLEELVINLERKKLNTQLNTEQEVKMVKKTIRNGSAYSEKEGELLVSPLNEDGSVDEGTEMAVEEAPESERKEHEEVAEELGLSKKVLKKIKYY